MEAIVCLKTRRSIRTYDARPVPESLIESAVDCGRLAATAQNHQPWTFVVVREAKTREELQKILGHAEFLTQAPVVIAVICRRMDFALEDGCAATQNLLNAAHALGLGSCWVAGHGLDYAPRVCELLGAPADQFLVALVSLGYPAEQPAPEKRPLGDVLRWDVFS